MNKKTGTAKVSGGRIDERGRKDRHIIVHNYSPGIYQSKFGVYQELLSDNSREEFKERLQQKLDDYYEHLVEKGVKVEKLIL